MSPYIASAMSILLSIYDKTVGKHEQTKRSGKMQQSEWRNSTIMEIPLESDKLDCHARKIIASESQSVGVGDNDSPFWMR